MHRQNGERKTTHYTHIDFALVLFFFFLSLIFIVSGNFFLISGLYLRVLVQILFHFSFQCVLQQSHIATVFYGANRCLFLLVIQNTSLPAIATKSP